MMNLRKWLMSYPLNQEVMTPQQWELEWNKFVSEYWKFIKSSN